MFALNIALLLVCAATVQGEDKKQCDYSDSECMTKASNQHFSQAIEGREGEWESSEPLCYPESIEDEIDDLKYSFSNISITGFSKCKTTDLSLSSEFNWGIECDELITSFNYKMSGSLDGIALDGEGTGEHVRKNYGINWDGKYTTSTKDSKSYLCIGETTPSYVSNGDQTYNLDGLSKETNEQLNKNAESVDEKLCQKVLTIVLKTFIEHINEFLAVNDMETLFTLS